MQCACEAGPLTDQKKPGLFAFIATQCLSVIDGNKSQKPSGPGDVYLQSTSDLSAYTHHTPSPPTSLLQPARCAAIRRDIRQQRTLCSVTCSAHLMRPTRSSARSATPGLPLEASCTVGAADRRGTATSSVPKVTGLSTSSSASACTRKRRKPPGGPGEGGKRYQISGLKTCQV